MRRAARKLGQASLLLLGVIAALVAGVLVLFAFGQALGAKGKHQRAADLAAMSAARTMQRLYPRLFVPPTLEGGLANPAHLSLSEYMAQARQSAIEAGDCQRCGGACGRRVVSRGVVCAQPRDGRGPWRRGRSPRLAAGVGADRGAGDRRSLGRPPKSPGACRRPPAAAATTVRSAYRMGKPMRPEVAAAFDAMAAARTARGRAAAVGQQRLSLGRRAGATVRLESEPEVGRAAGHEPPPLRDRARPRPARPRTRGWIENAGRFGFIHRYAWEPWH